jgi:MFS transporter, MHS family, alpha-ketoglutarate permease
MSVASPPASVLSSGERRKALLGTGLGNALEWFDWNIYAVFSVALAGSFFADGAGSSGLLPILLVFAVGFFFRPLGGLVLAALVDRIGRRRGLALMVSLMALGCLLVAAAPTHDQIGIGAPIILLVARVLQGLSTGGEFAAASTYLAEVAPPGKRGLYSSVFYISTAVGTITAVATSLVLHSALTPEQLAAWGWRIPFAIGAVLGVIALWIRVGLAESQVFAAVENAPRASMFDGIRRYPKASLQVFGMTSGITVWYYVFAVYLPVNAKADAESSGTAIDLASIGALLVFCAVLPLFGRASDRHGRRLWMLLFCGLATVSAVPLLNLFTPTVGSVVVVQTLGLLVFAFYGAIAPTLMSEMFPTEVRAAGIGLPYALAVAVFGGTSPYLLEWLASIGQRGLFSWYVAVLCLVSLLVSLTLVDRRDDDLRAL